MKKILFTLICATGSIGLFAGGIVTNTNQSASWARNPSTAASTGIEAVYYNPAATAKLEEGWHFSLNNQFVNQNRTIENSYSNLNQSSFKGKVTVPFYPTFYSAYKVKKLAFSFAFNPVGGGGSAEFKKGLPSLEIGVSDLVPALSKYGVNQYRLNTYFKGSSIIYGFQVGAAYEVNDMISVFAGVRYVMVKNGYEGYLKDVEVYNYNNKGAWTPAATIMTEIAGSASTAGVSTQSIINAGYGGLTFAQAQSYGILTATQKAQLEGGLTAFGGNTSMTINDADAIFDVASAQYTAKATLLGDQSADVKQTGSGICPIVGVNLSLDKLDIGVKYEFATKIKIKNKTSKDFITGFTSTGTQVTMFPDGAETNSDMPALLTFGASYKATEKLTAMAGTYIYFDKAVNYGKKLNGVYVSNDQLMNHNLYEISAGMEYKLTEKFLVSAGYLYGKTGVKPEFNSDLNFSTSSSTAGMGGKYSITPKMDVDFGVAYALYEKSSKTANFSQTFPTISSTESYSKNSLVIGIGINVKFSK